MATLDWKAIKTEYITSTQSQRELAEKYGVSMTTLGGRARKEKWTTARREYRQKVIEKATRKAADKEANRLSRLMDATNKVLDVVMGAFEDEKQFNRYIVSEGSGDGFSETSEKIFDKVDTKAVKDLTSVLKDLTGLTRDFYNCPTPAQAEQQRIAAERLELDKRRADAEEVKDSTVKVIFADDTEDYAQ